MKLSALTVAAVASLARAMGPEDDSLTSPLRGNSRDNAIVTHPAIDGKAKIASVEGLVREGGTAQHRRVQEDCAVIGAPTTEEGPERDAWLQKFKPCGWYKENCPGLDSVGVIEANVDYPPDPRGMVKNRNFIVQFDVGIHPSMVDAANGSYSKWMGSGESVIRLSDGVDLNAPDYRAAGGYVEGETCLEVYAKAGPDDEGDWGDIHGNGYGCMGKCGAGCFGAGYARDCMKHDVCGAFASVAKGTKSSGNCADVDCGDEQMQTVAHCHKYGSPVTCNREEMEEYGPDYDVRITLGALGFDVTKVHSKVDEAACFLWTGWEHEQGAPTALHKDGEGCPSYTHCESARCGLKGGRRVCLARKESGMGCLRNRECISNSCSGPFRGTCD